MPLRVDPAASPPSRRASSVAARHGLSRFARRGPFRDEVRGWLGEHLTGEFAEIGGRGGPADETGWELRVEWEKLLGKDRWLGLAWPDEYGGRGANFAQQIIFSEEYARANAPARISFFGEGLFAPTLLAYGTEDQKRRFLPKIQTVEELWCQG